MLCGTRGFVSIYFCFDLFLCLVIRVSVCVCDFLQNCFFFSLFVSTMDCNCLVSRFILYDMYTHLFNQSQSARCKCSHSYCTEVWRQLRNNSPCVSLFFFVSLSCFASRCTGAHAKSQLSISEFTFIRVRFPSSIFVFSHALGFIRICFVQFSQCFSLRMRMLPG